jgi:hypothetical protein
MPSPLSLSLSFVTRHDRSSRESIYASKEQRAEEEEEFPITVAPTAE